MIRISEIFGPTIQGEGALVGRPTVFVRTGGCDFRCSWCDTLYAVLPEHRAQWQPMSVAAILDRVEALSGGNPTLITLSGGNPALQPLEELLVQGRARGHRFAMETQGSVAKDWFALLDHLILSPKPPSSGMEFQPGALQACLEAAAEGSISIKIVVFDEADYQFARRVHASHAQYPIYLSVGNPAPSLGSEPDVPGLTRSLEWLLSRVTEDGWLDVTLLPQLHVLLWGNARGV